VHADVVYALSPLPILHTLPVLLTCLHAYFARAINCHVHAKSAVCLCACVSVYFSCVFYVCIFRFCLILLTYVSYLLLICLLVAVAVSGLLLAAPACCYLLYLLV
jgi:hypothetical protein